MTCEAGSSWMKVISGLLSWMFGISLTVKQRFGHLDTIFRGLSGTQATRVRLVIAPLVLNFVLPLDFHRRLRVIRSMIIPGALHGIEASFLADPSLRKLRTAIFRVVGSGSFKFAGWSAWL